MKRGEEEHEQYKIKFYPSPPQSLGNALPKETESIGGGNLAMQSIALTNTPSQLGRNYRTSNVKAFQHSGENVPRSWRQLEKRRMRKL